MQIRINNNKLFPPPPFQLKHCSRYIHDLFPSLIKNLDPVPLRHVLNLVSGLHPNAHTEQVQASERDASSEKSGVVLR